MPRYRFTIRNHDNFDNEDGAILRDDGSAREHAIQVMDELQKDDEADWAGFTMEVLREGRAVWQIPFDRPSLTGPCKRAQSPGRVTHWQPLARISYSWRTGKPTKSCKPRPKVRATFMASGHLGVAETIDGPELPFSRVSA